MGLKIETKMGLIMVLNSYSILTMVFQPPPPLGAPSARVPTTLSQSSQP